VIFGLEVDLGALDAVLVPALALALVGAATKLATGWWAARAAGIGPRGRARAGTVLIARGEFSIVIAGLGVAAGVETELAPLAAAYVLATVVIASLASRRPERLVRDRAARPS